MSRFCRWSRMIFLPVNQHYLEKGIDLHNKIHYHPIFGLSWVSIQIPIRMGTTREAMWWRHWNVSLDANQCLKENFFTIKAHVLPPIFLKILTKHIISSFIHFNILLGALIFALVDNLKWTVRRHVGYEPQWSENV